MELSTYQHRQEAPQSVKCMIITISDTRDTETDKSGKLIYSLLEQAGHIIQDYAIVKDEQRFIKRAILKGCLDADIDCIITNGGTGIAIRDVTIETVKDLYDKEMPGFGEIFRMLSYQEDIGSAAMLSRASAGVIQDTAVFSTPGSSGAVKLAMEKLIIPELGHVIREIRKDVKNDNSA